jgi:hypothetical protein
VPAFAVGCAVLALGASGCGSGTLDQPSDERLPALGALAVEVKTFDQGPRPTEGFTPYLELRRGDRRLLRRSYLSRLRRRLAPGVYTVRAWHRTACGGGSAGCLDEPSPPCTRRVRIRSGRTARLTVLPNFGGGGRCTLMPGTIEDFVGIPEADAEALARRRGFVLRVVERDGEQLAVTEDFSTSRINVAVRDGRVTRVDGFF